MLERVVLATHRLDFSTVSLAFDTTYHELVSDSDWSNLIADIFSDRRRHQQG